jgi:hypothetical protein
MGDKAVIIPLMITEAHLLAVIDAYAGATGASDTTISSRVFDDSKKLGALRRGASVTLRRANDALQWLSENWPEGAVWPSEISRPAVIDRVTEPSPFTEAAQ